MFPNHQAHGSHLQTNLPSRTEAKLLRGLIWCGGCILVTALLLAAHQVYISRTFAAHLAAGGVDDPDAVFDRWHILIVPFVALPLGLAFVGMIACGIGWIAKRTDRHARARRQIHQYKTP